MSIKSVHSIVGSFGVYLFWRHSWLSFIHSPTHPTRIVSTMLCVVLLPPHWSQGRGRIECCPDDTKVKLSMGPTETRQPNVVLINVPKYIIVTLFAQCCLATSARAAAGRKQGSLVWVGGGSVVCWEKESQTRLVKQLCVSWFCYYGLYRIYSGADGRGIGPKWRHHIPSTRKPPTQHSIKRKRPSFAVLMVVTKI